MSRRDEGAQGAVSPADRIAEALRAAPPELDELSRARLERSVVAAAARQEPTARAGGSSARWAIAGGVVALAAAVALFVLRSGPAPSQAPAVARFEVREISSAARRGTLEEGSTLTTDSGEEATLEVADSRVRLGASSRLRVTTLRPGQLSLELAAGEVSVEFHPRQRGRERLSVETPEARVEVVGTVFTVRALGGATEVAVTEGVVQVRARRGGDVHRLEAGAELRVEAQVALAPSPDPAAAQSPMPEGAEPTPPSDTPPTEAPPTETPPTEAPRTEARRTEARPTEAEPAIAPSSPAADPERELSRARARLAAGDTAGATALLRELARGSASPRLRAQAWTLLADVAQREGQLDEAADAYEHAARLAHGTSTGSNAIYALARLEERRRRDPDAARHSYRRYLEEAPEGPLAAQAREALCRLGDASACEAP